MGNHHEIWTEGPYSDPKKLQCHSDWPLGKWGWGSYKQAYAQHIFCKLFSGFMPDQTVFSNYSLESPQ